MKRRPAPIDYIVSNHDLSRVRNEVELRVVSAMRKMLKDNKKFDGCQLCTEDIYALSLNRLTAKYVQVGTIILKKETTDEEVNEVVKMTIEQVVNKPNHGD
ncbi:MAG: late competence development ComFB family protein [Nitrospinae bacterium]|nr:late competence development ComFB family protein [Nitrospinota bacterium]